MYRIEVSHAGVEIESFVLETSNDVAIKVDQLLTDGLPMDHTDWKFDFSPDKLELKIYRSHK